MARTIDGGAEGLALQVSRQLREAIISGKYAAGSPLRESALSEDFGVSRNTLREAFRELVSEGLIEQQIHRGVAVKVISADEIREIYIIRRTLELRGIQESVYATAQQLLAVEESLKIAEQAAAAGQWHDFGTKGLYFHCQLVSLIGSPRLNELFRAICAQLRLAFAPAASEERFQRPWVSRDRDLFELVASGKIQDATEAAESYFRDSERMVLALVKQDAKLASG